MNPTVHKILHFPLTKILIGIVVVVSAVALAQISAGKILTILAINGPTHRFITGAVTAVIAIISYILLFRYYETRKVDELSVRGIWRHLIPGILLGMILQSVTILVIHLNGGYKILAINSSAMLVLPLTMAFTSAIFEEIIVRGIIFRVLEQKLGSYIALALSAAIFGALHLGNPNSSIGNAIGLAIQAGLLLGVAYMYARNLWFPIAIHFAWNFTQAGVFGAVVSGGNSSSSIVTAQISGEEWYTGGAFGPEGSIQATAFCTVATLVLFYLCYGTGKIIKPYWREVKSVVA